MSKLAANVSQIVVTINGVELLVSKFEAVEELSTLYTIDLTLASEEDVDLDDMVGKAALLKIIAEPEDRFFHGIVSEFTQTETKGRFFTYQACVVPQVFLLSLRKDCRIFQEKSVPEIVRTVLNDAGIAADTFVFRLQGSYETREYCVQYRESEFNFISRLLEEEGIFYFFEHTQEKTLLVFGDGPVNYVPIPGEMELEFHPEKGLAGDRAYVYLIDKTRRIHSGKVVLRDCDFQKPSMDLTCNQEESGENAQLSIFDYPGIYADKGKGGNLAQVRLQEAATFKDKYEGEGTCPCFTCGHTFVLSEHDRDAFNAPYLLVSVHHIGLQPAVLAEQADAEAEQGYHNEFVAIPPETVFRPPRNTPKAKIEGLQTAEVVGPEGEEIYCDEHGRVKVWFRWDHAEEDIDKRSCWIRVCQTMAGTNWGAVWLPRVGHEVVVDFLEGNPDRPLIIGQVYNGANPPPYDLPGNKTRSTFKTSSSPGGSGFNEIRFEDKAGEEQIFIHAQKNFDQRVKGNHTERVEGERHLTIDQKIFQTVGGDQHLTVNGSIKEKANGSISSSAGGNIFLKAGNRCAMEGLQEIHLKAGMKIVIESGVEVSLVASGNFITINAAGVFINGSNVFINSGGAAGAGSGCTPDSPLQPGDVAGGPGRRAAAPSPQEATTDPVTAQQEETMQSASDDGTPFCPDCGNQRPAQGPEGGDGGGGDEEPPDSGGGDGVEEPLEEGGGSSGGWTGGEERGGTGGGVFGGGSAGPEEEEILM